LRILVRGATSLYEREFVALILSLNIIIQVAEKKDNGKQEEEEFSDEVDDFFTPVSSTHIEHEVADTLFGTTEICVYIYIYI
jgi:hypothetical protein